MYYCASDIVGNWGIKPRKQININIEYMQVVVAN